MRSTLILSLALTVACKNEPVPEALTCDEAGIPQSTATFGFTIDEAAATASLEVAGTAVVPLGDVTGDGVADLAVVGEAITVVDGAAWTAVRTLAGAEVVDLGDLDDDGLTDVAVVADGAYAVHFGAAEAAGTTFTAPDGEPIHAIAGGEDLDRDGRPDVLISRRIPGNNRDKEIVSIASGAALGDGAVAVAELTEAFGAVVDGDGPASLAIVGDFDGDGWADMATGATRNFAGVHTNNRIGQGFFGGSADQEVHLHDCHPDGCDAGVAVSRIGDVDGDRRADLLLHTYPDPEVWIIGGNQLAEDAFQAQISGGVMPVSRQLVGAVRARPAISGASTCGGELLVTLDTGDVVLVAYSQLTGDAVALPADPEAEADRPAEERAIAARLAFADLDDAAGVGDVDGDGADDLAVLAGGTLYRLGSAGASAE